MLGAANKRTANRAAEVNQRYARASGTIELAYPIAGIAIESSATAIAPLRTTSIRASK